MDIIDIHFVCLLFCFFCLTLWESLNFMKVQEQIFFDILGVLSFGFNSKLCASDDLTKLLFIVSNFCTFLTILSIQVLLHCCLSWWYTEVTLWSQSFLQGAHFHLISKHICCFHKFYPWMKSRVPSYTKLYLQCALLQPTKCDHRVRMEL